MESEEKGPGCYLGFVKGKDAKENSLDEIKRSVST